MGRPGFLRLDERARILKITLGEILFDKRSSMRVASKTADPRRLLTIVLFCLLAGQPAATGAASFEGLWLGIPAGCDVAETIVPPGVTTPVFRGPSLGLSSLVPFVWDRSCGAPHAPFAAASGRTHMELDDFRLMHSGNLSFTLESNAWFAGLVSASLWTRLEDAITVTGGSGQGLLRLRLSYTASASSSSAQEPFTHLYVYVADRAPAPFAQRNAPGTLEVDIPFSFGTPVTVMVEIGTTLEFPEIIFQRGASASGRLTAMAAVLSAAALTVEGQPIPGAKVISNTNVRYPEPPPCPGDAEESLEKSLHGPLAPDLFVEPSPAEAEKAKNGLGSADRGVLRSRLVRLSLAALEGAAAPPAVLRPEELTMNLFPGLTLHAVLDHAESRPGGLLWTGHLHGKPLSQVSLVVNQGRMTGKISWPQRAFSVRHVSGGLHRIQEIDVKAFPREASPLVPPPAKTGGIQAIVPETDDGSTVDVMVVYTSAARAGEGGTPEINDLISLAVSETNQAYASSNVIQRLRLVHTAEVSDPQSGDLEIDLRRLTDPSDGLMDEVHALRNLYGADLVHLVVDTELSSEACGIGWLMQGNDPEFGPNAFSVTERACALVPTYSFAHELGHNMGLNHARSDTNEPGTGAYPYAYGYKNPGGTFRDVMAYDCPGGCPRILHYSNPDVLWCGEPTGVIYTALDSADNARALNNTRLTVANWRASRGDPPGAVTLIEPSGTITTATPTYDWHAEPTATDYLLWVNDSSGRGVVQAWYSSAAVCSGGRCSAKPPTALVIGVYQWRVLPRNAYGNGLWSSAMAFTVSAVPSPWLFFDDGFESGDFRAWSAILGWP